MESDSCFHYEPLENPVSQIRLVDIIPAQEVTESIRCNLRTFWRNQAPRYTALSYVWGDPTATTTISINSRSINVTTNLELALRCLRSSNDAIPLWIDALCINQKDDQEKSKQVSRMREVYMNAETVNVWLGEEEDAGLALDFLREIHRLLCKGSSFGNCGGIPKLKDENDSAWIRLRSTFSNTDGYEANWTACDSLFHKRQWWRRTWIIQEVAHAGEVAAHIGKIQLSLEELCELFFIYTLVLRELRQSAMAPLWEPAKEEAFWDTKSRLITHFENWKTKVELTRTENNKSDHIQAGDNSEESVARRLFDKLVLEQEAMSVRPVSTLDRTPFDAPLRHSSQVEPTVMAMIERRRDFKRVTLLNFPGRATVVQYVIPDSASGRELKNLNMEGEDRNDMLPDEERLLPTLVGGLADFASETKNLPGKNPTKPLLDLLSGFRRQTATDPRDKVYAMLGMAKEEALFTVDYSASINTVYRNVVQQLVVSTGSLDIICYAENPSQPPSLDNELPSWCPDWSMPTSFNSWTITEMMLSFNATRDSVNNTVGELPGGILFMQGSIIGLVSGVTNMLLDLPTFSPEPFSNSSSERRKDALKFIRVTRDPDDIEARFKGTFQPPNWPTFLTPKIALDTTSWGPYWTEIGDMIVLVPGCRVPLVLRPLGPICLLIGPCVLIQSKVKDVFHPSVEDEGFESVMFGAWWDIISQNHVKIAPFFVR
jgi:hypothetical protein